MATNDVYLRPDAGDGTNGVRLRPDAPDTAGALPFNPNLTFDVPPRQQQRGFADVAVNLLLTTLAVVAAAPFIPVSFPNPAPAQYFQAPPIVRNVALLDQAPFKPTQFANPVTLRATQDVLAANLLPSLLSQRPFIPGLTQDVASAVRGVPVDVPQNLLGTTLAPVVTPAPFIPALFVAPQYVKFAPTFDAVNLLGTTLAPVATPAPFIPVSFDAPQQKRVIQSDSTVNLLPLAQRPFIPTLFDQQFAQKSQKTAFDTPNLLVNTLGQRPFVPFVFANPQAAQQWQQAALPPNLLTSTLTPIVPPEPVVDWGGAGRYRPHRSQWEFYQIDKREWEKKIPPKAVQAIERVARSSKTGERAEQELRLEIAEWDARYAKMLAAMQAMQLNSLKVLRQMQLAEWERIEAAEKASFEAQEFQKRRLAAAIAIILMLS